MTQIPEGTKFTHICLVYFQDEMRPKNKNDKVVDDTSNEETMKSTCRQSEERRQRNSPQLQKCSLYFALKSHYIKRQNRQVG